MELKSISTMQIAECRIVSDFLRMKIVDDPVCSCLTGSFYSLPFSVSGSAVPARTADTHSVP